MAMRKYTFGRHSFEIPDLGDAFWKSEIGQQFNTMEAITETQFALRAKVQRDEDLSPAGKAKKLAEIDATTWRYLANKKDRLAERHRDIEDKTTALMAIGKATDSAERWHDREIRDWWGSLDMKARFELIAKVQQNPAEYDAVVKAILRSPIPGALEGREAAELRSLNAQIRRLENPALASEIDEGRAFLEAAQMGMGHVEGILRIETKWTPAQIAEVLAAENLGHLAADLQVPPELIGAAQRAAA